MIKGKKVVAIIPVRKNSKGIKNKNLIKIGKYSLLERTILIAKKSKFMSKITIGHLVLSQVMRKEKKILQLLRNT